MKKKRPKDSIFHDSIKNKRRKQGEKINFYRNNENSLNQSVSFTNQNMINHKGMNYFFSNRDDSGTGKNASTREHTPLFGLNVGLEPDYTYQTKDDLGSGFTYKAEEEKPYLYGFTNSKFIYFLGTLEPRAYLVFVTLIGLLILEDLNDAESKILYAFISNVGNAMQAIIEQQIIVNSYSVLKNERAQGDALQKDFEILYSEIARLKKEMSHLKS